MTSLWPALVAVGLLAAVEAREARTTVAAVASLGRGTAARAAVLPGLALVALGGGAVIVLAVLPRAAAVMAGGVVVLVAGLQWLMWAARRELGTVPLRDEPTLYDALRREGPAWVGGALLRAGAETLVLATATTALAGGRPLWLPPLALLLVNVAIAPALTGRRPGTGLALRPPTTRLVRHRQGTGPAAPPSETGPATWFPERPAKAAIAVLLTAQGTTAVTSGAVGVPLAALLCAAGLLALTMYGRRPHAPGRTAPAAPASRRSALRDFVLGDDLAVWWATAALFLAAHLPPAGFDRGPAALLLTALLAALLGRTARRPRTDPSGGDR